MPCYLLKHPDHGQHICYTPEDVEKHKAIGWTPVEEAKPAPKPEKLRLPRKVKPNGN